MLKKEDVPSTVERHDAKRRRSQSQRREVDKVEKLEGAAGARRSCPSSFAAEEIGERRHREARPAYRSTKDRACSTSFDIRD